MTFIQYNYILKFRKKVMTISFAENLKRIREGLKISQADLARELEISYQTYNGYETKGNDPSVCAAV